MHLVVLRRNNIDLPEVLPPSLVPKIIKKTSDGTSLIKILFLQEFYKNDNNEIKVNK